MHPSDFNAYCFVDKDGKPWTQTDFHEEWLDAVQQYPRVQIEAFRESAKTEQISIGYSLWRLGNNPDLRIKVVSANDDLSKAIIGAAGEHIERNERLHEVFPRLKPDKKNDWNATRLFISRDRIMKDPTFSAHAVLAGGVGGRCDILIFDDVCDMRNTISQPGLKRMVKLAVSMVWLRLLTPGGQVIWLDTPWDVDDASADIDKYEDFYHIKHPVYKRVRNKITGAMREVPRWPEKHSVEYLQREEKRDRFSFNTQMRLLKIAARTTPFFSSDLIASARSYDVPGLGDPEPGHVYVSFWDLGRHTNRKGRNATVCTTIDVTETPAFIRNHLLYEDVPYNAPPDDDDAFTVSSEIERIARLYPGETVVEANAAGESVIEGLDIIATYFNTTSKTKVPMIQNLANAMSNNEIKWRPDERLDIVEEQLRNYTIQDDNIAQDCVISLAGAAMFCVTEGGSGTVI